MIFLGRFSKREDEHARTGVMSVAMFASKIRAEPSVKVNGGVPFRAQPLVNIKDLDREETELNYKS